MIKNTFYLIFLCSLVANVKAKCLTDIAAGGVSFDSVTYKASTQNDEYALLPSDAALGAILSKVIYCYEDKIEYRPFIRLRTYKFSDTNKQAVWGNIEDTNFLFSAGLEIRKELKWKTHKFEIPFILEVREELGFEVLFAQSSISQFYYKNLKLMSGVRYYLWRKGRRDLAIAPKLGLLYGFDDKVDAGPLLGISLEYFQRMGKSTSFELDLFYDQYAQDINELTVKRKELGTRANLIWRY